MTALERRETERERKRKMEKKGETKEGKEKEGRFQYAGADLSIHFRGQRLRDEEPLHPRRLSRPSWFHGTVSQRSRCRSSWSIRPSVRRSIDRSITRRVCSHSRLGGEFGFGFFFFSPTLKMGTIHHRRAERNLLLILRDRLVRSRRLVFLVVHRVVSSIMGMDREGGWDRRDISRFRSCSKI